MHKYKITFCFPGNTGYWILEYCSYGNHEDVEKDVEELMSRIGAHNWYLTNV